MREKDFKRWLLSNDFSLTTIDRAVRYLKYIESRGLQVDSVQEIDEVLEFFAREREKGVSRKTLNNYVKQLNRYFRFMGVDITLKYYREFNNDDLRVPTDEEMREILNVSWSTRQATMRNRAILSVLFTTGLRVEECRNLNWNDIDFDAGTLTVRSGKWGKSRVVPVPPWVLHQLLEYQKVQEKGDPNAVFTTYNGRMTNGHMRKIVKEAGVKAGVPWFHAHAARHWRALSWLKAGVNLETIRRLMGHSSLKTTQIYLRALAVEDSFGEIESKDPYFKVRPLPNTGGKIKREEVKNAV